MTKLLDPPSMHEISIGKASKLRQLLLSCNGQPPDGVWAPLPSRRRPAYSFTRSGHHPRCVLDLDRARYPGPSSPAFGADGMVEDLLPVKHGSSMRNIHL